jgi:hypothetical protein
MKRGHIPISFILFFWPAFIEAMDVHVAPLEYIDEVQGVVDSRQPLHTALLQEIQRNDTGTGLQFFPLRNRQINPPRSVLDAVRVCQDEHIDFLLYGFISKRDYTFYAEIKFFDYAGRAILKTIFAADDLDSYDRMLTDLSNKIISYVNAQFNLAVLDETPRYTELWIPVDAGYWTPLGTEWNRLLMGTVAANTGLQVIPLDRLFVSGGKSFYISTGLGISYRLGMGNPSAYEAYENIITITGPVRLHLNLNRQNSISAGLGVQYSLDIMTVQEHYLDVSTTLYNTFGLEAYLGYTLKITKNLALYLDNVFEARFFTPLMFSYSPRLGIKFLVYSREEVKKW